MTQASQTQGEPKNIPSSSSSQSEKSVRDILNHKMKNGEAVLLEVGKLGKDYQDWIHTTRTNNMLRFFEDDFVEKLSYCPWWTVPIFWFPVITYLLWTSAYDTMETIQYYLLGFAGWPALEYALHRFVFHMHTETYWWNTLHFVIHGNHHVSPQDHLRLVFPPAPASIITFIIGSMIISGAGKDLGLLLIAGLLTGYVCYDLVHFGIHSPNVPPMIATTLRQLKIHHSRHHRAVNSEFGITNIFLDNLLGTTEEGKSKPVMKMKKR